MGRPCKCRYCQTSLTTEIAYMEYLKDKKAYFCNEEHYNKFLQSENNKEKAKHQHDRVCELFAEILGVTKITNTALYKEKAELNEVYSDEVIISYLEENKGWIITSVGKLSSGIYGKIRYVSVILRNKLGDYKPKVVVQETVVPKIQDEHYETKFKLKKRRGFEDLEDDCDE